MASLIGQLRDDRKGGGLTCSKGPQVKLEPQATAARTKLLHIGHLLYQLI